MKHILPVIAGLKFTTCASSAASPDATSIDKLVEV